MGLNKDNLHWATFELDATLTPGTTVNDGKNSIHLPHTKARFTVGRECVHDWVINNPSISSLHCIISYVKTSSLSNSNELCNHSIETDASSPSHISSELVVTLIDNSRNGMYINNKLLGKGQSVTLHDGDHIHIVKSAVTKYSCYNLAYYFRIHPVNVEVSKGNLSSHQQSNENRLSSSLMDPSTQELSPTDKLRVLLLNRPESPSVRQLLEAPVVTMPSTKDTTSPPLPTASYIPPNSDITALPALVVTDKSMPSVSQELNHTEIEHSTNEGGVFGTTLESHVSTPENYESAHCTTNMLAMSSNGFELVVSNRSSANADSDKPSQIPESQLQIPAQHPSTCCPSHSTNQHNNVRLKYSTIQGRPSVSSYIAVSATPTNTQIHSQTCTYSQTAHPFNRPNNVTLDDVYYLYKENPIGKGSFGVVYRATPIRNKSTNHLSGPFYAAKIIDKGKLYFLATSEPNANAVLPLSMSQDLQSLLMKFTEDDENRPKDAKEAAALEKSNKALKELLEMDSLDGEDIQEVKTEGCGLLAVPRLASRSPNEEKLSDIGNKRARETEACNSHDDEDSHYVMCDKNDAQCRIESLTENNINRVSVNYSEKEWLHVIAYRNKIEEFERRHHTLVSQLLPQTSKMFRNYLQEKLKWKREITILQNINHSSLIRTFDVFCEKSTIAMILELAEGGTLFTAVQNIGPFPEILVKVVLYQLLQGVAYLHCRGIVHRDIKLENILLSKPFSLELFKQASLDVFYKRHQGPKNGVRSQDTLLINKSEDVSKDLNLENLKTRQEKNGDVVYDSVPCTVYCDDLVDIPPVDLWPDVKITDFGLSKVLGCDALYMTTMCGTPIYVAPEVTIHALRRGLDGYTSAVDIYSLAVLAFALLTARPPFPHVRNADGSFDRTRMDYMAPLSWERNNKNNKYHIPYKPISEACKDLLRVMFVFQPKDRITASEALRHHWFREVREALNDD